MITKSFKEALLESLTYNPSDYDFYLKKEFVTKEGYEATVRFNNELEIFNDGSGATIGTITVEKDGVTYSNIFVCSFEVENGHLYSLFSQYADEWEIDGVASKRIDVKNLPFNPRGNFEDRIQETIDNLFTSSLRKEVLEQMKDSKLEEDVNRFRKKVRKNPPPRKYKVKDIDDDLFYYYLKDINKFDEELLYNELAEAENLDYKVWVFGGHNGRQAVDASIDGLDALIVKENDLSYIEYNKGDIRFYYNDKSVYETFPVPAIELFVKYPEIFGQYDFYNENFLKRDSRKK